MLLATGVQTNSIRIGVDGLNLAMSQGTGVATYARSLCTILREAGHPVDGVFGLHVPGGASDPLREVLFFGALEAEPQSGPPQPTLIRHLKRAFLSPAARHLVEISLADRVVAQAFRGRLPKFDRVFTLGNLFDVAVRYFRRYRRFMPVVVPDPPAIMHWTYPLPIRLQGAANIYTIHDLVPLRLPHTSTEDKRYHFRMIETCLAQADHICTVSEASRRDILDMFPNTDPARITNTYQAVDAPLAANALSAADLEDRLKRLFDLERENYFLYFGALEPKKNLGRLIEAYLGSELKSPLVIVGSRAWRSEKELRLLNGAHGPSLKGMARIHRFDYLPQSLLMLLVRGARAVVFPSLYEGFGLPVLEAMTLRVPVLTSTTSSLPEVAGEAALKVDPYNVDAIAEGLRRLEGETELRQRLAAAGPVQAAKFSKAAFAERLAAVYEGVLSTRNSRSA